MVRVGVLAIQGAFAKHLAMLARLGVCGQEVKKPEDLVRCDALILPGGESPTLFRQIDWIGLKEPLQTFAKEKPVFGTCAGLILMAGTIVGQKTPKPYGWLNISVERNGWGRQVESFITTVAIPSFPPKTRTVEAVFIRAPRIQHIGDEVEVLATYQGEPVLVKQGMHLGATFHPELTDDPSIHQYFLKNIP